MSSPIFLPENQLLGTFEETNASPRNTVSVDHRTALDCNAPRSLMILKFKHATAQQP